MAADFSARLREILDRYDQLTEELSSRDVASDSNRMANLAREQSGIAETATLAREWLEIERGLAEARGLVEDSGGDREMAELAREEIASLEARRAELHARL